MIQTTNTIPARSCSLLTRWRGSIDHHEALFVGFLSHPALSLFSHFLIALGLTWRDGFGARVILSLCMSGLLSWRERRDTTAMRWRHTGVLQAGPPGDSVTRA